MDARAGDLAGGKHARDRRPALEIRLHAAHDVVRGRTDRNPVTREIEPGPPARLRDQREPGVHERGIEMLQRQIHGAGALRLANDRPRDAIARRQIARRDRSAS